LEGRWAKLTLYAHLHKFIDITKEIHPIIEAKIFDYIEGTEILKTLTGYPRADDQGQLYYLDREWIKPVSRCILSWMDAKVSTSTVQNPVSTKIAMWKELNKKVTTNE
jgi:hypothetical protein